MKIADIILIVVVVVLFILCVYKWITDIKKGKCCGSCNGCSAHCENRKDK